MQSRVGGVEAALDVDDEAVGVAVEPSVVAVVVIFENLYWHVAQPPIPRWCPAMRSEYRRVKPVISITAPGYVPFEPRTDAQRATQLELRQALAGLRAEPGETLRASFSGVLPTGADVENALFYNLDAGGVFAAMAAGASFEIDPTPPETGVRYEYETGPAAAGFRHWRADHGLATFGVRLGDARPSLAAIWWALRPTPGTVQAEGPPRAHADVFTMTVSVHGPAPGLTPGLLKTILDGTICGLQSEADAARATAVAPLIATGLGASPQAILYALVDGTGSALGSRTRFVHRHGPGVKWEPDDDRLVAALVTFVPADEWRVDAIVATATPVPSGA